MKSRVILFVVFLTSVFALSLAVAPAPPAAAAVGTTYTVTSTSCTGPGSITEAMANANANSGEDTITFTKDLRIDAATCPDVPENSEQFWILNATESVTFEGNGAELIGAMLWINSAGDVSPLNTCPLESNGNVFAFGNTRLHQSWCDGQRQRGYHGHGARSRPARTKQGSANR